jgi:hypothetical protein
MLCGLCESLRALRETIKSSRKARKEVLKCALSERRV